MDKYIRFDWAVKRLLRNKANFGVLEGLLTVLLNRPIQILDILESESNQQDDNDKFNRVDIKARDSEDEIIIVEVQVTRELYFLERILYGAATVSYTHLDVYKRQVFRAGNCQNLTFQEAFMKIPGGKG